MTIKRWVGRTVATALAMASLVAQAATPGEACGEHFRNQRITLVVPFAAGGGYDQYARAFAPVLQQLAGARVVVSNMPAAGGLVAMKTIAGADAEHIQLGLLNVNSLIEMATPENKLALAQLVPLGAVNTEMQAWLGRADFSFDHGRKRPLVAAVSGASAYVIELGLPAHLLDLPFRFVTGYKGSVDRYAAVLRGEVDITSNSLSSIRAAQAAELKPVLVLSDGPVAALPGIPYLAGKGGMVDSLTAGKPAAERAKAMQLAKTTVDLSMTMRGMFVSSKVTGKHRECLRDLVETALFSDAFAHAVGTVERPVEPVAAQAMQASIGRMVAGAREHDRLLKQLIEAALQK